MMRPLGLRELRRRAVAYEVWRAPVSASLRVACYAGLIGIVAAGFVLWWPGELPRGGVPDWARPTSVGALLLAAALTGHTDGFQRGGLRLQRACLALGLVGAASLFVVSIGLALLVVAWAILQGILRGGWALVVRP